MSEPISLREAAEQLRSRAERFSAYALCNMRSPDKQQMWTKLAKDDLALAKLLDGDGGLLRRHYPRDGQHCDSDEYLHPCPDLRDLAAYVSAVLGVEVRP